MDLLRCNIALWLMRATLCGLVGSMVPVRVRKCIWKHRRLFRTIGAERTRFNDIYYITLIHVYVPTCIIVNRVYYTIRVRSFMVKNIYIYIKLTYAELKMLKELN